jgi:hypothetical protein
MNKKYKFLILAVTLIILVIPGTAVAKELQDDRIVAGGSFTLDSGEKLSGSLVVFGGTATTEVDSIVEGDVVVLGGSVTIDGLVEGNVVGVGGAVNLEDNAVIEGDVTTVAASLDEADSAIVHGQKITNIPGISLAPGGIQLPDLPRIQTIPGESIIQPIIRPFSFTLWGVLWFIFRTLLWGAWAALVVMFLPNPTTRASQAIMKQPLLTGGVGLLTVIVAPVVLIVLLITIILIPISILAALALLVAWFFGRIALGLEIGQRIARMFDRDWPLPILAGIGTFALALVIDSMSTIIPCVGWLIGLIVGLFGLGGVLLTLFGTRPYPPESESGLESGEKVEPEAPAISETSSPKTEEEPSPAESESPEETEED